MDLPLRMKLLQIAAKMQDAIHELYFVMNEHPELSEAINRDKLGDADYRISLLAAHLVNMATS